MTGFETMLTSLFTLTSILILLAILFRSAKLKSFRKRIDQLEEDLLQSHKEILELEQQLTQRIKGELSRPKVVTLVPDQEAAKQQKKTL